MEFAFKKKITVQILCASLIMYGGSTQKNGTPLINSGKEGRRSMCPSPPQNSRKMKFKGFHGCIRAEKDKKSALRNPSRAQNLDTPTHAFKTKRAGSPTHPSGRSEPTTEIHLPCDAHPQQHTTRSHTLLFKHMHTYVCV